MTVPTQADIVAQYVAGQLAESIFTSQFGCKFSEYDALSQALVEAHRSRMIDVHKTLCTSIPPELADHEVRRGRQICEEVLPQLDASAARLLSTLSALYGTDSSIPYAATDVLTRWCKNVPSRALELLEYSVGFPEHVLFHALTVSIQTGLKADYHHFAEAAINLVREGSALQKIAAIQALTHAQPSTEPGWKILFQVARDAAVRPALDELRAAIFRTSVSWVTFVGEEQREELTQLLLEMSRDPEPLIAHQIAYALAFSHQHLSMHTKRQLLDGISHLELSSSTFNLLDIALQNSLQLGDVSRVQEFVTERLSISGCAFGHFNMVFHELSKSTSGALELWLVSWLRRGDAELLKGFDQWIFPGTEDHHFTIDFTPYGIRDVEYGFIAKKAILTFFIKPIAAVTVIVSLLRHAPLSVVQELEDLLFDPMLINYPNLAKETLHSIANDPADPVATRLSGLLQRIETYTEGARSIGLLPEMRPSEREQLIAWQHQTDAMETAAEAVKDESSLERLFAQRVLLYGAGMASWTLSHPNPSNPGEGVPKRYEAPLTEFYHPMELPREEILNPVGIHHTLMHFHFERPDP